MSNEHERHVESLAVDIAAVTSLYDLVKLFDSVGLHDGRAELIASSDPEELLLLSHAAVAAYESEISPEAALEALGMLLTLATKDVSVSRAVLRNPALIEEMYAHLLALPQVKAILADHPAFDIVAFDSGDSMQEKVLFATRIMEKWQQYNHEKKKVIAASVFITLIGEAAIWLLETQSPAHDLTASLEYTTAFIAWTTLMTTTALHGLNSTKDRMRASFRDMGSDAIMVNDRKRRSRDAKARAAQKTTL